MKAIKNIRYWRITFISLFLNFPISILVNTGRTFGAIIGINGNTLQFIGIIQTVVVLIIGPIWIEIYHGDGPYSFCKEWSKIIN